MQYIEKNAPCKRCGMQRDPRWNNLAKRDNRLCRSCEIDEEYPMFVRLVQGALRFIMGRHYNESTHWFRWADKVGVPIMPSASGDVWLGWLRLRG